MKQRKWEFITQELIELKAPKKVINAAIEIDNAMITLELEWNTKAWSYYNHKYTTYYKLSKIIRSQECCTACVNAVYICEQCKLCYGLEKYCTPRSKYADLYFEIVDNWVTKKKKGVV